MSEELLAGWSEADITPDGWVVELAGQYYQRVARGIHSRLGAVALVLRQGDEATVMISVDVLGVPAELCVRLRAAIAREVPQIDGDRVLLNAIHTHSAPGLGEGVGWYEAHPEAISPQEYGDLVEQRLLQAVREAWDTCQPAGTASALGFAPVGHCRRAAYADGTAEMYGRTNRDDFAGMEGGEDSGVELLFFCDRQRAPLGAIVNVPCPSQVTEAGYRISSDFMGALRRRLKSEYGEQFRTLCQIGAAGCQSPRDLTRPRNEPDFWHEDGVDVIAGRLHDAVREAWPVAAADIAFDVPLRHVSRTLKLPRRRVSAEENAAAQRELARLEGIRDSQAAYTDFCAQVRAAEETGGPGPYDSKLHHFVLIRNAEAVVKRYGDQDARPELETDVHVVRIGDAVLAGNPFELYQEYGQRIRARSPAARTFVVQLANGQFGYLPSSRAEQLGGYGGMIVNGQVGSQGGGSLVEETLCMIRDLYA